MMRYSKLFSRILLRLLSEHKHKRTLKVSAYKLISLCLEKCGYAFAESIYKPLVASILEDLYIVEHKAASIINTANQGQQKKSHKKRRTEVTNSDSLTNKLVSASSTEVQVAALDALATLLEVFGFAMENGQRASVDGTVLSRLIQVIQPSNMSDEEIILVKAGLYQCLIASVSHPIETQASILPHASRLFAAGVNDQSHELQVICKKGLTVCDLVTHARLPPIQRVLPKTPPAVVITAQEIDDEMSVDEQEEEEEEVVEKVIEQKKVVEEVKQVKSVQITPVTLPAIAPVTKPVTLRPVEEKAAGEIFEGTTVETIQGTNIEITTIVNTPVATVKETIKETVDITLPSVEAPKSPQAAPAAPTATAAATAAFDEDEDMDMEIAINMSGPDSDEDDDE